MADISFAGQTVIVTGAGQGLGRSHAIEFGRRGASVVVDDILEELVPGVVKEVIAAGGKALGCSASVATPDGAKEIVDTAVSEFGPVDVLVNNAGILRTGYFQDLSDAAIDEVLEVHLRAAFTLTQLVWPIMSERHYGRIVMTSSNSGMFSHQGLSNYAAAKAGLYGLTKALAFEGADHGIKVNAILPVAPAPTHATKEPIPDQEKYRSRYGGRPAEIEDWRMSAQNISALVTYLASRERQLSGEAFSSVYGRYARVFVGVADGWIAPDEKSVSADSVAEHLGEIRDITRHSVPMWMFEESGDVANRIVAGN